MLLRDLLETTEVSRRGVPVSSLRLDRLDDESCDRRLLLPSDDRFFDGREGRLLGGFVLGGEGGEGILELGETYAGPVESRNVELCGI